MCMYYGVIDIGTTNFKLFIYDDNENIIYYEKIKARFVENKLLEQDSKFLCDVLDHFIDILRKYNVKSVGLGVKDFLSKEYLRVFEADPTFKYSFVPYEEV